MAATPRKTYSSRERAFFAPDATVQFVRPGLVFTITSAQIAADGTVTARVKVTDPQGLALDRTGVNTPGVVAMSFIFARIPQGQTQYAAYTVRTSVSTINGASAIQAGADTGGTLTANSDGDYIYKFGTKAPSGFDATVTHTIGVYGSRNLTLFDLGTNYASATFNFVPNGSPVTIVRDVVRDASCTRCHDVISFHGGSRVGVATCVLCHTPQTTDPDTGNTLDFSVFIHKLHDGSGLPSVRAGKPYQIIGFGNAVSDWSNVVFPADPGGNIGTNSITGKSVVNGGVRRCETCHEQNNGATQAANYLTNPTRAACGACHDDVNFATGLNHVNLPQPDDSQCKMCHIPQGELEYDASIKGAHTIATESAQLAGMNFQILKVASGSAGSKPAVTFTVKDNAGNPVAMSELKVAPARLALVLAGPASDPGYTNFGADVTTGGYVSENATTAICGADGMCNYTFTHAIPANATGTFSVGIEGRRAQTLNPGTTRELANVSYGGKNVVFNFSVDGSLVASRRTVVSLDQCNTCHVKLSLHGENRNQIEMCVLCHNPSETDAVTRAQSTDPAQKNAPAQGVNFALLVHRLHSGDLSVVGFGGSLNTFDDVVFPTFHDNGSVGATNKCYMCHANGTEENLPLGLKAVKDPKGIIPSSPAITSACMGCHNDLPTASHATSNANQFGESCTVCHSSGAEFAPDKVHTTCAGCP